MGQTNVNKDGLAHGDTNSDGKFLRSNNGAAPSWETVDQTTIPVSDEDTDTTSFPVFTTGATGDQAPKTNEDKLKFNAGSGTLQATNLSTIASGGSIRAYGVATGGGGNTDSAFLDAEGVTISATAGGKCELRFQTSSVTQYVGFKGPSSGDVIWELPAADGSSNQVLKTSGSGVLSWTDHATDASQLATGDTASRPGSPSAGACRLNTDTKSFEYYNGQDWVFTHLTPSLDGVSGNIESGQTGNLTLTVSSNTSTIDVVYKEGSTVLATVTGQSVSSGTVTVATPAAVYGQSVGDTVVISIKNTDISGTPSQNSVSKTVVGVATGGTITTYTSGGTNYKVHKFTSSDDFVIPSGLTLSNVTMIACAGGASSGQGGNGGGGGGGGGGGCSGTVTISSITAGTYAIAIGAGGSSANGGDTTVADGLQGDCGDTHWNSGVMKGGGRGGWGSGAAGSSGGSGGGGNPVSGGAGGVLVAGQGNVGGWVGSLNQGDNGCAGGGGYSTAGSNASWTNTGRAGGDGLSSNIVDGSTSVEYSAGGNGGNGSVWSNSSVAGAANTGEGAKGGSSGVSAANGGSGVVIFRYTP